MPHRIFENRGIFTYDQVRGFVDQAYDGISSVWDFSNIDRDAYLDLLMLTAAEAEVALPWNFAEVERGFRLSRPVVIRPHSALAALFKFDSTPTWPHLTPSLESIQWFDVILFSGDISKVVQVGGESVAAVYEGIGFETIAERLTQRYGNADNRFSRSIAASDSLQLLGALRYAKVSVMIDSAAADDRVIRYLACDLTSQGG